MGIPLFEVLSAVALVQTAGSTLLFPLAAIFFKKQRPEPGTDPIWHVLQKGKRYKAVEAEGTRSHTLCGFLFAALFLYALPVWWYLWGIKRTLILIVFPYGAAVAVSLALTLDMLYSVAALVPFRVAAGIYVRKHYYAMRKSALQAHGWAQVAVHQATSATEAIRAHRGKPSRSCVVKMMSIFSNRRRPNHPIGHEVDA